MIELDGFEVMPYIDQRTNKGKIASRDKRIEQLESEIGGTRTISIPSLAFNYVDNKLESIGYQGELYVRQRLLESYGQVPEQGERAETGERESYSRWFELFGTPERAVRTLELLHVELSDWCAVFSECRDCMFGQVDGERVTCREPDDFSLVEWLRGDVG